MAKEKQTQIIAFANNKGGVAKTTTAQSMAAALSKRGKSVLIVDSDPQGNISICYGIEATGQTYEALQSVDTTRQPQTPTTAIAANCIQKTGAIDLLTGGRQLQTIEGQNDRNANRLGEALKPYFGAYDFILIDTPPAISFLTLYALFTADFIVIPTAADVLASKGLANLRDTIEQLQKTKGTRIKGFAVLLTKYKERRGLDRLIKQQIEGAGFPVFSSTIRECIAIGEAQAIGADVFRYAPKSNAAKDYEAATNELLQILKKQ